MSDSTLVRGPSEVSGTSEAGSGFLIGDHITMTAGHVAFEYDHSYGPSKWYKITESNIVRSLNGTSLAVLLDPRGYQTAYAAEARILYQAAFLAGDPAPTSESIEKKFDVYKDDIVFVRSSGKVTSTNPGMVYFENASDITATSLQSYAAGATVHLDGYVSKDTLQGDVISAVGGILTFNHAAQKGDSGGAFLLDFLDKNFVIGDEYGNDGATAKGAYFTESDWQKINALLLASQAGDVTLTEPTNLIVGTSSADSAVHSTYRADIVLGRDGDDVLNGGDGIGATAWAGDQLYGGIGNDTLNGGLGSNLLVGGDRLSVASTPQQLANDGNDTADYSSLLGSATHGIKITVSDTAVSQGFQNNLDFAHAVFVTDLANPHGNVRDVDTLISIETIKGTAGDDLLSITNLSETLLADSNGVGGLNKVDLGEQRDGDLIDLSSIDQGVSVHLDTPDITIADLAAPERVLHVVGAEKIIGSGFADDITGSSGNDVISTGDGADSVHAGNGDDVIFNLAGGDFVDAGPGNDQIVLGSPALASDGTKITGGVGNDTIWLSPDSSQNADGLPGPYIIIADAEPGDRLIWNGYTLAGGTFTVLLEPTNFEVFDGGADWLDSHGTVYEYHADAGTLDICLPDNSLVHIDNFQNGDFGMTFDTYHAPGVHNYDGLPRANIANERYEAPEFGGQSFHHLADLTGRADAFMTPGEMHAPMPPDPAAFLL